MFATDRLSLAGSLRVPLELLRSHMSTVRYPLLPLRYLLPYLLSSLHCRRCLPLLLLSAQPLLLWYLSILHLVSVQLSACLDLFVHLRLFSVVSAVLELLVLSLSFLLLLLLLLFVVVALISTCLFLLRRLCRVSLPLEQSLVRLVLLGLCIELLLLGRFGIVPLALVDYVM